MTNNQQTIQESTIGDVLEDGSIVVDKQSSSILLIAPASTEVRCVWSEEFKEVFDTLKSEGFNPEQWIIPTNEQLQIAYDNCRDQFTNPPYWSSTDLGTTSACLVPFNVGRFLSFGFKDSVYSVRAFQIVNF